MNRSDLNSTGRRSHERDLGSGFVPRLAGRDAEMKGIASALGRTSKGSGGALFLAGEPGIGKTRLAQEALSLARARGFTVLEGQAYPLEAGLAYSPVLDAFRPLLRSLDASRQSALLGGLPDLGRLFGGLNLPAPDPLGDPALEKTRLFEAVSRFLDRLARERPVALFIDDLHWADPASLELLHYLARGLSEQSVLLLAAYHAGAVETVRGLRALVTSLIRARIAEEIVVSRLDPDAVASQARDALGGDPPAELLALLEARARGTPLFVEAIIQDLIATDRLSRTLGGWTLAGDAGVGAPSSVRHSILDRIERLDPSERLFLDLICVMGEGGPHSVLAAASGLDDGTLLRAFQRLRVTGLVVEQTTGPEVFYRVTHPLIQQVTYDELPEMARRRAHSAVAAALERLRPDDVDRLARHYSNAGPEADRNRALSVMLAAGERARAICANDEAARHFGAALALVREGYRPAPDMTPPSPILPWLLERLGEAWDRVGEGGAALEVWAQALSEHVQAGDAASISRLHRLISTAEWDRGRLGIADTHLVAGLEALAGREPSQDLSDLHFARFNMFNRLGDLAGVTTVAADLIALSERLASPQAEAQTRMAEVTLKMNRGDPMGARDSAQRALGAAENADHPILIYRAHDWLALTGLRLGDHGLIRRHSEGCLDIARRLGAPVLELIPRQRLTFADFMSGEWKRALKCNSEGLALARRMGNSRGVANLLAARAMVLAFQGNLADAEACISETRLAFGGGRLADRHVFGFADLAETVIALEQGEAERAYAITARFPRSVAPPGGAGAITGAAAPIALALLGRAQMATGRSEEALAIAAELTALDPEMASYSNALGARLEGLARISLGEAEAARACLERATEAFTVLEMPFEAACSRMEWVSLATAGRSASPPLEAMALAARESLMAFETIGALRYVDRARKLLRKLGVSPEAKRRAPRTGGRPLSPRELDAARLVADGLSTVEIAARLTLSPRTITTHLDHIYSRLGFRSRASLARYVTDAGLLSPEGENT